MKIINGSKGPYNNKSAEGRGANAGHNVAKLFKKNKLDEIVNSEIQYTTVDEKTGKLSIAGGLAYSVNSSKPLADKDGNVPVLKNNPYIDVADFTGPEGKPDGVITPGENLAYAIFQDTSVNPDGKVTPGEVKKTNLLITFVPEFIKSRMKTIYEGHNLAKREKEFKMPKPNIFKLILEKINIFQ